MIEFCPAGWGKVSHRHRSQAVKAVKMQQIKMRLKSGDRKHTLVPYRCHDCGNWHVGNNEGVNKTNRKLQRRPKDS